jgi:diguanylate cyclase (GGDEF)-like protein
MPPLTLRTLVGTIGLAVAIITTVSIPLGYFLVVYTSVVHNLSFVASLNASEVAKLAVADETLWQHQPARIAQLIQLPDAAATPIRQRVYDRNGMLALEDGDRLNAPILTRSMPIVVAGSTVGRMEVETSLRGLLYDTGLVVGLSLLLGAAVYFAVRILPLNVLYRTFDALETAERQLQDYQNMRFDAALNNMSQGLCMFNSDGRLVTFNRRFAEMFKVPSAAISSGITTPQIMDIVHSLTNITEDNPDLILSKLNLLVSRHEPGTFTFSRTDGHVISASHQPMADGGWVQTFDDITEQRLAEAKLSHMAHHDMLTGLPNRLSFYQRLDDCLARMTRGGRLALFSLDLDNFKAVNDTLGHPLGDRLLQAVAERLRDCIRQSDLVARLGGDEFAVVQIDADEPNKTTMLASRLIEVVSAPYDLDGHQVVVGMSVGVAMAPGDGIQPDGLTKNADLAMYRAKADGGNTYRFFEPQMDARMRARREIELDLRKAVVNGEFELHYQPVVNLQAGKVTCFEALIRWHHPERGLIQPMEFIPIAEETGLIVPLGRWVLRQACAEAATWPQEITVAVNVSPAQFNHHNLVHDVVAALEASGLPGSRLEVEITELVLLKDNEVTLATLHELRSLGVRIAMDDFGTGYSSIGYLRSFPFDKIKIDQSFIRSVADRKDSLAIIRAVVGLGSSLGVATTAEGVETQEQLDCLRFEGCTEAQGFLISRPRPAGELQSILLELGMVPSGVAAA